MAVEIEHKYLVESGLWNSVVPNKIVNIKQGYLSSDPNVSVRVRVLDDKGFVTVKGKTLGAKRLEFEYEIPLVDAEQMLREFGQRCVEKKRHYVLIENKIWEVDVFEGLNEGLIIAEIELTSEDERYFKPDWVTLDITQDYKYSNSNLAIHPYSTWK